MKMKIKVEYSESIQVAEGLWRKIGIEVEEDSVLERTTIDDLRTLAKEYVERWHKEAQSAMGASGNTTLSMMLDAKVIDRSIERLKDLIADCKTLEELDECFKNNSSKMMTDEVFPAYITKKEKLIDGA